jgi:hypothetical protein
MSGGIAQLVAVGAQDVHLVGQPEISFFRSTYKRHTNFSQTVERQVIQGNVSNNGMSTVRFERKGDLLNYVYFVVNDGSVTEEINLTDWTSAISKVELLVGGQVIDEQDSTYSTLIAPTLSATTSSKSVAGDLFGGSNSNFYPLRFAFCENWQSALPLIALQYHDVELRITWGSAAASGSRKWDVYANYAYLDTQERDYFASTPQNMIITQVQKATASGAKIQELNFNHPVKYLAAAGSAVNILGDDGTIDNKIKLQINGTDVADYKFANPNFSSVPLYYHTTHASSGVASDSNMKLFFYPFCLDAGKLQPTGTLNFSRLDSARILSDRNDSEQDIYAVNYNVLRIENGMGGLLYSN